MLFVGVKEVLHWSQGTYLFATYEYSTQSIRMATHSKDTDPPLCVPQLLDWLVGVLLQCIAEHWFGTRLVFFREFSAPRRSPFINCKHHGGSAGE